jgi:hypothetical protein
MSELRQDLTTGRWVIIAPQRGLRPGAKPLGLTMPQNAFVSADQVIE